jgi:hypothetical protein
LDGESELDELLDESEPPLFLFASSAAMGMTIASSNTMPTMHPTTIRFFFDQEAQNFHFGV